MHFKSRGFKLWNEAPSLIYCYDLFSQKEQHFNCSFFPVIIKLSNLFSDVIVAKQNSFNIFFHPFISFCIYLFLYFSSLLLLVRIPSKYSSLIFLHAYYTNRYIHMFLEWCFTLTFINKILLLLHPNPSIWQISDFYSTVVLKDMF